MSTIFADDDTLVRRACAAHLRACEREGVIHDQPANTSYVTEHERLSYVVLVNGGGVLAVYRVRNDGTLKGLRRWPKDIES